MKFIKILIVYYIIISCSYLIAEEEDFIINDEESFEIDEENFGIIEDDFEIDEKNTDSKETVGTALWGEAGYILNLQRIDSGLTPLIADDEENDNTDEYYWLFQQEVYLNLNFNYSHLLILNADLSLMYNIDSIGRLSQILDQLYITVIPTGWLSCTFGKQNLEWGTARVFTTIEKLKNSYNPLELRTNEAGLTGIKAVIIPSEWFSFSLIGFPEPEVRWSHFALRIDMLLFDIDFGIGGGKYNHNHYNIDPSLSDVSLQYKDAFFGFIDFIRFFGDFGIYLESALYSSNDNEYAFADNLDNYLQQDINYNDQISFKLSTGIHYQMTTEPYLRLIMEYHYNHTGYDNNDAEQFEERYLIHKENSTKDMYVPSFLGHIGGFRKHYGYIEIDQIMLDDNITVGCACLANFESLSTYFLPKITFSIEKKIFITFNYAFFYNWTGIPSDFNFINANHKFTMTVSTDFSN